MGELNFKNYLERQTKVTEILFFDLVRLELLACQKFRGSFLLIQPTNPLSKISICSQQIHFGPVACALSTYFTPTTLDRKVIDEKDLATSTESTVFIRADTTEGKLFFTGKWDEYASWYWDINSGKHWEPFYLMPVTSCFAGSTTWICAVDLKGFLMLLVDVSADSWLE